MSNKRLIRFGGLLTVLTVLLSVSVAADLGTVFNKIREYLSIIFLGDFLQANFYFWGKFLLFWLVFAILFFASQRVLPEERRNLRLTVSLIVSMIGVIPLKTEWIELIFGVWHGIIGILLVCAPLAGLIY